LPPGSAWPSGGFLVLSPGLLKWTFDIASLRASALGAAVCIAACCSLSVEGWLPLLPQPDRIDPARTANPIFEICTSFMASWIPLPPAKAGANFKSLDCL